MRIRGPVTSLSAVDVRNVLAARLGCFFLMDLGGGLVNDGTTPADGGAVTSVLDALGGQHRLAGTGFTYSTTHAIDGTPVLVSASGATLLSTSSPIFDHVDGGANANFGGVWALNHWTMRALVKQVVVPVATVGAGMLIGKGDNDFTHSNASLLWGGAGFSGNKTQICAANGLSGANVRHDVLGAAPTLYHSITATYDGARIQLANDGQDPDAATYGSAFSWDTTDAGFGLGSASPVNPWAFGTSYIARCEWYAYALPYAAIRALDADLYQNLFPSLRT